ncbi:LON peptidase substrate-binding domain-containing protein [Shewanella intestini]|uniref:ATP-dependent protease n=1 Tax=Shewanella intestini TaxID=2017544 RepID=A0ABS5I2X3_9GAMM|nr:MULTISPECIES: LON peptidase substrate-binding domain-containing protein [Shewanella]MBR9728377.1 ATP-dependent protease [Shewanella intestini]MRG36719.1 ATP-dependent protease [Shewanella sp. XMDDZSB0408]
MRSQEMALLVQDAVLLPSGRVEIEIVSPSELNQIARVLKGHFPLAFGALKASGDLPCYMTATQCNIIDFNQTDSGALSVILEGHQRIKILSTGQRSDGALMARTLACPNWQHEPIKGKFEIISAALEQFYQVNPELLDLYSHIHLEDASWVSQRWLEVLPMYNRDKIMLADQPNCHKTMNFVLQLLKSHVDG